MSDPRLHRGAAIDFTPTKQTADADVYKYYCPICMMYFKQMIHTSCCKNYICKFCVLDLIDQQSSHDVPCPFCTKFPLRVLTVHHWEDVKSYQDEVQLPNTTFKSPIRVGENFQDLKRKMLLRIEDGFGAVAPAEDKNVDAAERAAQDDKCCHHNDAAASHHAHPHIQVSAPSELDASPAAAAAYPFNSFQSPVAAARHHNIASSLSFNLNDSLISSESPSPIRRRQNSQHSGSESSPSLSESEEEHSILSLSDAAGRRSRGSANSSSPLINSPHLSSVSHNSWLSGSGEEGEIPARLRRHFHADEPLMEESGDVEVSRPKRKGVLRRFMRSCHKFIQSLFCVDLSREGV